MSDKVTSRVRDRARRLTGEFVLIVVGVLVALAADGWLEGRRERGLERQYLAALRDALEADTTALGSGIRFSSQRSEAVRTVLRVMRDGEIHSAAAVLLGVHIGGQFVIPATETAVVDELLSAGRFLLIGDVELRRRLLAYYRGADHPVNDRWRNTIWYRYRPVASRVLSLEAQDWAAAVLYQGEDPESLPLEMAHEVEQAISLLRQEPGIHGLLQEVAISGAAQIDVWTIRRERAGELLRMIGAYLE